MKDISLVSRKTHIQWNNSDKQQMTNRMNNKSIEMDKYDMNSNGANNKSVNSDLYQAVFPIYYLSKLSGVFPTRFVAQVSGRYQGRLSVTDSIYSVCLLVCLISAEIWGFWRDLRDGWEHSTRLKSQNAVIVTTSDVMGVMSLTACSIVGSILCWKHVQTIIDILVDCDEKLGIVSPKKIRRYTILLTLWSLLYSIIISSLDIYTWNYKTKLNKKLNDKGPINYVPLYFMYIVIIMMEVQYAVVVYNVSQRFCRLNKNLENIFNSGRITDQFKKELGLDGKNFTDSISQLMTVHASLSDTVMLINTAYGVVALMITITCLIHLIITPYFLIMEADGRREPLFLAVQGLWCIFHIWRLFMIVQPTYAVTTQGKKTAVLISQLLSVSLDKESKKQLEIFSLQLLHRPLEFSACGLFTLDRTLVTSIAGAVTTYLVILIQFQKEDDTKDDFDNILKNATQMLKNASTLHNFSAGR
ncbi:gustatory receptor for sugar taste 43a-like [Mycetomoellerius zeteki]|uniref:gustatory receptor for sugar taste 43a-like n=1 Tax=Mycetomoellerius zeteki TaxID=64791 RepID=UPI00084E62C4|nr:PREDICTED: gustatory receptor for sugar taste 43a-like [Trachymyrmex zeteki]